MTTSNRQAFINEYYTTLPSEHIEFVESELDDVLGPNEVLVKQHATALNRADDLVASGFLSMMTKLPHCLCGEISGVVTNIGNNVTKISIGDEVYGSTGGGHAAAEYVKCSENNISVKPTNISFLEAATFPCVFLTSYQCIYNEINEGDRVFILGGSSGTGSMGIQLAKAKGCFVGSTCSTRNVEFLESLNVDVIVNYENEIWYDVLSQDWDVIYDCVGVLGSFEGSKKVLREGGKYLTICLDGAPKPSIGSMVGAGWNFVTRKLGNVIFSSPDYAITFMDASKGNEDLQVLTQLVEDGVVHPTIDRTFSFENIGEAMDFNSQGKTTGKVAIQIVQ